MLVKLPRHTFPSVLSLITQIRNYIAHWNTTAKPFTWTETVDDILVKVQFVQTNIRKLAGNNAKSRYQNHATQVAFHRSSLDVIATGVTARHEWPVKMALRS